MPPTWHVAMATTASSYTMTNGGRTGTGDASDVVAVVDDASVVGDVRVVVVVLPPVVET